MDRLVIRGARQHNLKNVSLDLPRHAFVVLTGPSGSGKSSLAFDTIYAEGQRRYVESLSAYARQYLEQLGRPDVDGIDGLSPAIAIEQRPLPKNPRSTVGTVTEIADYLRLLFARIGIPHCPRCGKRIEAQTVPQIVDRILALGEDARVTLLAPIVRGRRSELKLELAELRRQGFVRARIDGVLVELSDEIVLDRARPHDLDLVIDRFPVRARERSRVHDSVELALERGEGRLLVVTPDADEPLVLSERFACVDCGVSLPPIEPRMFSFNSPHGACPACSGIGVESLVDPERVVPNPARTLREGAIAAWGRRGSVSLAVETDRAVRALGVPADVPWRDLPKEQRDLLLFGPGDDAPPSSRAPGRPRRKGAYEGIVPRLQRRLAGDAPPGDDDEDGDGALDELSRFFVERVCGSCGGKRLRPEALAIKLGGLSIADVGGLALAPLRAFCEALPETYGRSWTSREARVGEPLLSAVRARLGFLVDVGLDYLTLDRSVQSLSGGEAQRIRLATQIGAALSGVLYVLDEPSVGLHARDNARLLEAVRRLVTLGNGVLVVEHDREAILAADHVVDMGPGAGEHGGTIVAQGRRARSPPTPRR